MKAPKKLKYPKKPKMSASLQVKENYLARCKEIDKENTKRHSDFNKAKSKEKSVNAQLAKISGNKRK